MVCLCAPHTHILRRPQSHDEKDSELEKQFAHGMLSTHYRFALRSTCCSLSIAGNAAQNPVPLILPFGIPYGCIDSVVQVDVKERSIDTIDGLAHALLHQ